MSGERVEGCLLGWQTLLSPAASPPSPPLPPQPCPIIRVHTTGSSVLCAHLALPFTCCSLRSAIVDSSGREINRWGGGSGSRARMGELG